MKDSYREIYSAKWERDNAVQCRIKINKNAGILVSGPNAPHPAAFERRITKCSLSPLDHLTTSSHCRISCWPLTTPHPTYTTQLSLTSPPQILLMPTNIHAWFLPTCFHQGERSTTNFYHSFKIYCHFMMILFIPYRPSKLKGCSTIIVQLHYHDIWLYWW